MEKIIITFVDRDKVKDSTDNNEMINTGFEIVLHGKETKASPNTNLETVGTAMFYLFAFLAVL
jgi:hypothetical protein